MIHLRDNSWGTRRKTHLIAKKKKTRMASRAIGFIASNNFTPGAYPSSPYQIFRQSCLTLGQLAIAKAKMESNYSIKWITGALGVRQDKIAFTKSDAAITFPISSPRMFSTPDWTCSLRIHAACPFVNSPQTKEKMI